MRNVTFKSPCVTQVSSVSHIPSFSFSLSLCTEMTRQEKTAKIKILRSLKDAARPTAAATAKAESLAPWPMSRKKAALLLSAGNWVSTRTSKHTRTHIHTALIEMILRHNIQVC